MDTENLYEPGEPEREDEFARHVTAALRRVEAPAGFTERVMASAALREVLLPQQVVAPTAPTRKQGVLLSFSRPAWRAVYAAAALLAITAGTVQVVHTRGEQRRTDAAVAQFEQAMQVTGHALDRVSAQLERTEFGEVQRALETNGGK